MTSKLALKALARLARRYQLTVKYSYSYYYATAAELISKFDV